jgi:hypothetical protein
MKHLLSKYETKVAVYANRLTFARHKRIVLKSILGGLAFALLLGMSHTSYAKTFRKIDVVETNNNQKILCMKDIKNLKVIGGASRAYFKGDTATKIACAMPFTKGINVIGIQPQIYRSNRALLKIKKSNQ